MLTDGENQNLNGNKKNDGVPEWLAQFRRELAGSEESPKTEPEVEKKTPYANADFQKAESVLLSANGAQTHAHNDYHAFALSNLAGYEKAITRLRFLGFGDKSSAQNDSVIAALNRFHGMSSRPALRPILIIGESPEEIEPLLNATSDELMCPTVKLAIQDTPSGLPGIAAAANKSCMDISRGKPPLVAISENNGLLIMENIEDWSIFFEEESFDGPDGPQPMMPVRLTPAGREFLSLIEHCADNPRVQIICTTCEQELIPLELLDIIGDMDEVKIEPPNKSERIAIWNELANRHPSLRGLNNAELANYCESLSRHDIEVVAQEAITEAYNSGLKRGFCNSVTRENLMEKIILRQEPGTVVFAMLEDALVNNFARSFED